MDRQIIEQGTTLREEFKALYSAGNLDGARSLCRKALTTSPDANERLAWMNNLAMVERECGLCEQALTIHLLSSLDGVTDHRILAKFHQGLANTYQRLDRTDDALIEYSAAGYHYQKAHDFNWVGSIENNIAFLLIHINKPLEALPHLDEARKLFSNNTTMCAQIDDTRAEAFFKVGMIPEAIRAGVDSFLALYGTDERLALEKTKKTLRMILE